MTEIIDPELKDPFAAITEIAGIVADMQQGAIAAVHEDDPQLYQKNTLQALEHCSRLVFVIALLRDDLEILPGQVPHWLKSPVNITQRMQVAADAAIRERHVNMTLAYLRDRDWQLRKLLPAYRPGMDQRELVDGLRRLRDDLAQLARRAPWSDRLISRAAVLVAYETEADRLMLAGKP